MTWKALAIYGFAIGLPAWLLIEEMAVRRRRQRAARAEDELDQICGDSHDVYRAPTVRDRDWRLALMLGTPATPPSYGAPIDSRRTSAPSRRH
jgi:hypothetical protein